MSKEAVADRILDRVLAVKGSPAIHGAAGRQPAAS
jgi:hypothetical protein